MIHVYSSKNIFMVVHVYLCLFTGIILVQIHTGILTGNGTGIFMFLEFQESRAGVSLPLNFGLAPKFWACS